jgi:hypothetical protein
MSFDFHARFANHLATAPMRSAVDFHAALEARTHTAKRSARLAGNRRPASAGRKQDGYRNR